MTTMQTIINGQIAWEGSVKEFEHHGSMRAFSQRQVEVLKATGSVVLNKAPHIEVRMVRGQ